LIIVRVIIWKGRVRGKSKTKSMDFGFRGATARGLGREPISEEWITRATRRPVPKPNSTQDSLNRRTSSIQVKCIVQLILILGALKYDSGHAASKYAVLSS
jgi:hypothetical protein